MGKIDEELNFVGNMDEGTSKVISELFNEYMRENNEQFPDEIYILPLRNNVLFPQILSPIVMGREKSVKLINDRISSDKILGIVAQKDPQNENPTFDDLYQFGTVSFIQQIVDAPDDQKAALVIGMKTFRITEAVSQEPFLTAKVEYFDDDLEGTDTEEFKTAVDAIKDIIFKIAEISPNINPQFVRTVETLQDPVYTVNFVATNFEFDVAKKIELLKTTKLKERVLGLLEAVTFEYQKAQLQAEINNKVKERLDKQQKEFILHQQLKTIQSELGDDPFTSDIENLKKEAQKKKWPKKVADHFERELKRLERLNPGMPDYGIQLSYLQTLLDLPWGKVSKDNFDLQRAKEVLDKDHYGLDKVKERILEYLAVLKLKGNLKSPIICLYGPPGVGKTSLGKSIAKALNRKYIRMSLGGLHDEAEIRGHRRTYIGAMPGRIIQNIRKAKTDNPVFVLDEIDKIGQDFRGDPSSALLEVLDPEQNNSFYDNYLEVEYDLSNVLFIATANTLSTIKPALLDRMEIIDVTGYILEEKIEIAKRHLIPKQLKAHGVKKNQVKFSDEVIKFIVENYTRESGVRELDKQIAAVIRKVAKSIAMGEKHSTKLTVEDIHAMLGVPKYSKSKYFNDGLAGVVTGLAWTSVGGEILTIESSLSRGTGNLTLTGNLGKIMKESATIALQYVKAHYLDLKIHPLIFKYWDVHLHVPEGAIPKDGPSAGITMATSLASLFTQRKVKPFIAMTGELTLSGRVLPVGGIKEKILAAKRAGIKEIILSSENKKDIEDIKEIYRKGLTFHYVDFMSEVLDLALLPEKVERPLKIGIPKSRCENKESK